MSREHEPFVLKSHIGDRGRIRTHEPDTSRHISFQGYAHSPLGHPAILNWCREWDSNPPCNAPKAFASFLWATAAKKMREFYLSQYSLVCQYHQAPCVILGYWDIYLISIRPFKHFYGSTVHYLTWFAFYNGYCITSFIIWEVKSAKLGCIF